MVFAFVNQLLFAVSQFPIVFLAEFPVNLTGLTTLIVDWIIKIVSSVAVVYLVVSLVGQIDPAKRDLKLMSMEIFGTVGLIALIAKSNELITLLLGAVGITN